MRRLGLIDKLTDYLFLSFVRKINFKKIILLIKKKIITSWGFANEY